MKITDKKIWKSKSGLLKRIGMAGFIYFLVKGLIWVGIALFVWLGVAT